METDSDEDQALEAILNLEQGREEFGGLDNETLDFSQLEDFITDESDAQGSYFADTLANSEASKHGPPPPPHSTPLTPRLVILSCPDQQDGFERKHHLHQTPFPSHTTTHNLPDSPPDSGSEPPYSPTDPGSRSPRNHGKGGGGSLHDLLIHHPMFPPPSQDLAPVGSPILPHLDLTTLRGPTPLIPISPSPAIPNTSPTTLTTLVSPLVLTTPDSAQMDIPPPFYTTIHPSLDGEEGRGRKRKNGSGSSPSGRKCNVKQEPSAGVSSFPELSSSDSNTSNPNNGNCAQGEDDFGFDLSGDPNVYLDSNYQCIKFQPFQETTWHSVADRNFKDLGPSYYKVDADKGFNFSNADDAFVCQKKNHFQVTCHARQSGDPMYVRTPEGFKVVNDFFLHFYGVKVESPNQTIKIEQSQSDRSKKPFHPVMVDLSRDQTAKVTVGRLHFNETTSNNMRKKGKPNPDQRYFFLVVALQAHCADGVYPIVTHASQRIIVRASNPGQFESDMELSWQKGQTSESVYHAGRVGINTDRPDEALVIYGNCKVTGQIVHPSDARAKHDISELDTKEQLANVQKLRVVRYKYNPEFARLVGLAEEEAMDTGVIAQEVQAVLPEAVKETGSLEFSSGTFIPNFLVVNKERIFMENIGAVKELCKVTGKLETRIDELEKINNLKLNQASTSVQARPGSGGGASKRPSVSRSSSFASRSTEFICSNKIIQIIIVGLVIVMALSLAAMATLYFLDYHNRSTLDHYHHHGLNLTPTLKPGEGLDKVTVLKAAVPRITLSTTLEGIKNQKLFRKEAEGWTSSKIAFHPHVAPPVRVKPRIVGRPEKCVQTELSRCKVYCCSGIDLRERSFGEEYVERGNQVASGNNGLATVILTRNLTSDGTPVVTGNLMQRNGLEYRRRRQVHDISRLLNVPSISLESNRINQTLDGSYCLPNTDGYHDCVATENKYFTRANLTYAIPLSKYWDEVSLSIVFNVSSKFDVTHPAICKKILPQHICSLSDTDDTEENGVSTDLGSDPSSVRVRTRNLFSLSVAVGSTPHTKVTLRFSTDLEQTDVCSLSPTTAKVFEFTFYFYRLCEE